MAQEANIQQLQILEQNLQALLHQKQQLQSQLLEIESAEKELNSTDKEVYKMIGPIMILSEKNNLAEDLSSQKEIIKLKIKNIDSQERKIKEQADILQSEVLPKLKNE
jgi:prefoldin beta subunit